jgi:hypothetical protein
MLAHHKPPVQAMSCYSCGNGSGQRWASSMCMSNLKQCSKRTLRVKISENFPSALSIRWHCVAMSLCKFTQYSLQWAATITPQIAPSPWPASILHCLHFVYVGSCSLHCLKPCCNKNIDFSWFQILRWQCLHLISTQLLITRPLAH